jgi:hypothetical protein
MPRRPPLLAKVTVAESAFDETYAYSLHIAVSEFVSLALQAEYLPEELPEEAVRSYWLSEYIGTVANGGHAYLVANLEFPPDMRRHVRTALAKLALPEHQAIFADMETFARRHPARLERCHGGADEIDPYFYELDRRYGALPRDGLMHAQRRWLLTRDWIEVLPDRAIAALRGRLVPPHPQAQARRDARMDPSMLDLLKGLLRRH